MSIPHNSVDLTASSTGLQRNTYATPDKQKHALYIRLAAITNVVMRTSTETPLSKETGARLATIEYIMSDADAMFTFREE